MIDVIEALGETDARDELGIGGVRDALSDTLFPGTSTIQTRARYFLFVPWIYRRRERPGTSPSRMVREARRDEIRLIYALLDGGETRGVIGSRVRENLQRMPSGIYWQGLGAWRIRLLEQSQDVYHRSADGALGSSAGCAPRDENGEPLVDGHRGTWHAGLPPEPEGFLESTTFSLTRGEAEYLRERILTSVPGTLLAFLVGRDHLPERAPFPWEIEVPGLPEHLDDQLCHARTFSELMHGAALLYNLMVAQAARRDEVVRYKEGFSAWASHVEARRDDLAAWDLEPFWRLVSSTSRNAARWATRRFVGTWKDMVLGTEGPGALAEDPRARDLIRERERRLKREWARLSKRRAREKWGGASGAGQLDYRWGYAHTILSDVFSGLEDEGDA